MTGLIDLFILGVDVDTITSALEVNINKNIKGVDIVFQCPLRYETPSSTQ